MDVEALLGKIWLKSIGRNDRMFAISKITPFFSQMYPEEVQWPMVLRVNVEV